MELASKKDLKKLTAIRNRLADCEAEIDEMASKGLTLDDALRVGRAALQRALEQARYKIRIIARPGDQVVLTAAEFCLGTMTDAEIDARFKAALEPELVDVGPALADRPAAVREIKKRILALLVDEEKEVARLEAEGLLIERRPPAPDNIAAIVETWDD